MLQDATSGPAATLNDNAPRFCVTLVHGTFARGAGWTKEGSALRRGLESHLGAPIVFDAFEWSGENSHSARRTAGVALRQHLQETRRRFPTSVHVVIGHSHGGTVALYARKADEPKAPCCDGIITIATPYLSFRPRRTPWYLAPALGWIWTPIAAFVAWLVIFAALLPLDLFFSSLFSSTPPDSPVWLAVLGLYLAVGIPAAWFAYRAFARVIDGRLRPLYHRVRIAIARRQNALVESGPWPIPDTRILNLQVTFDEATWYLRALEFGTNLGHLAFSAFAYLVVTVVLMAWQLARNQLDGESVAGILLLLGGPIAVGVLLCSVVVLIHGTALACVSLVRGSRFGLSHTSFIESFIESLLVRVSVGSSPHPDAGYQQRTDDTVAIPFPIGGWLVQVLLRSPEDRTPEILPRLSTEQAASEITQLKIAGLQANPWRRLSLRHSTLYVTGELIEMIAGWMLLTARQRELVKVANG